MDKFVQPYDDKQCMKMAMLKHEETFKQQVYELHRLYQIQKILMKNIQSNRHNHQENICFSNYQEQQKINNTTDLDQSATTKDYEHATETLDSEIDEDESEIELTLAPTSFNRRRRMSNKPESSDSVTGFSSSSSGSSNIQKVEIITRGNSSFLSGNRRNMNTSSSNISVLKQLPAAPWMYQVLSLNMA